MFFFTCVLSVTKPAGLYLRHQNVPIMSIFSADSFLLNKNIYTLIRVAAGVKNFGATFVEVF